ncbi:MAG: hypothetical protein M3179_03655 [Actinomycetota bacterium]|nr:hypothetical protein [Actinomycetota bacterium]
MRQLSRAAPSERGQATFSVVVAIVVVAIGAVLLTRIASLAEAINVKAGNIAQTVGPISEATTAVGGENVDRVNELATSIRDSAVPLRPDLDEIINLAKSIDARAASINGSASGINNTAGGINATASQILGTARSIDAGVQTIIRNLDTTLNLVTTLKGETGNVVGQAVRAHQTVSCIDQGVPGGSGDGHCTR